MEKFFIFSHRSIFLLMTSGFGISLKGFYYDAKVIFTKCASDCVTSTLWTFQWLPDDPALLLLLAHKALPMSSSSAPLASTPLNMCNSWATAAETMSCAFAPALHSWKTLLSLLSRSAQAYLQYEALPGCYKLPTPLSLILRAGHALSIAGVLKTLLSPITAVDLAHSFVFL